MSITRFGRFYTLGNGKTMQFISGSFPLVYSYTLSVDSASVDEGDSVIFSLSTTNQSDGTTIPYTIYGTNISASDFSLPGLSGNFTIVNNAASFSLTLAEDYITEGSELFNVKLDNNPNITASVLVADTSQLGTNATYTLVGSGSSDAYYTSYTKPDTDEGHWIQWNLTTTNIPDGTHVSYSVDTNSASRIKLADIDTSVSDAFPDGSFIINNNSGSIRFKIKDDLTTEATSGPFLGYYYDTFVIRVFSVLDGSVADYENAAVYDTSLTPSLGDSGPSNTIAFTNNTSSSYYSDSGSAAIPVTNATHTSGGVEYPLEIQFEDSGTYRTSLDDVQIGDSVYYTLGNTTSTLNPSGNGWYGFNTNFRTSPTHTFRVNNGVVAELWTVGIYGKIVVSNSAGGKWAGSSVGAAFVINTDGSLYQSYGASGAIRSTIDSQQRVITLTNSDTVGGFRRFNNDGTEDTIFDGDQMDTVENSSATLYNVGVNSNDNVIFSIPTNTSNSYSLFGTASLKYNTSIGGVTAYKQPVRKLTLDSGSLDQNFALQTTYPLMYHTRYSGPTHWVTLPNEEMIAMGDSHVISSNTYPGGYTSSYAHIDSSGNFKTGSGFNFNGVNLNDGEIGTNSGIYIPEIDSNNREILIIGGNFTSLKYAGNNYTHKGIAAISSSGELLDLISGSDDGFTHVDGIQRVTGMDFSGSHLIIAGTFNEYDDYPAVGLILFKWNSSKNQFEHDRTFDSTSGSVRPNNVYVGITDASFGTDGNIYAIGGNDYWDGVNVWGSAWGTVWKFDLQGNVDSSWVTNAGNGYESTQFGWQKITVVK